MDDSKKRDRQKYYYESVHSSVDHLGLLPSFLSAEIVLYNFDSRL